MSRTNDFVILNGSNIWIILIWGTEYSNKTNSSKSGRGRVTSEDLSQTHDEYS